MGTTRTARHGGSRRLANCLPDRLRSALSTRVDEVSRLQQAWHACVPDPLGSHVHPVRYVAGLLFLQVNTPAWASRLRHEKPALIDLLRKSPSFRDLGDIRFRVIPIEPAVARQTPTPTAPSRISTHASRIVAQTAKSIADPSLRAALERLAGQARNPDVRKRRP